jgi:DNA-binding Xre family transcriptional regulator
MSESARIIDVLKRTLKTRGLTYRDVAGKVGLSEASIKRVFAEETFTLQRLEKICTAIGMSVGELVRMASDNHEPNAQYLSLEQEALLAANSALLACFYLLLNGRPSGEIQTRLNLTERELRSLYVKLDDARLAELQPGLKARLRVGPVVNWRSDGPVRRVYERHSQMLQPRCSAANWNNSATSSPTSPNWIATCPSKRNAASRCCWRSDLGCSRCLMGYSRRRSEWRLVRS